MRIVDNSDAELDAFEDICQRLGGFDPRINAEWLDGYLCALAAGPLALTIDDWLPRATGDAFERAFADPDDVARARAALLARWRVLQGYLDPEALLDEPDELRLQPLVSVWDDEARQSLIAEQGATPEEAARLTTGAVWALGFIEAVATDGAGWKTPADVDENDVVAMEELLAQVGALILAEGQAGYEEHLRRYWGETPPTRDALLNEACFAVQELRVWWLDHAPRPATRRVEPAPGRNDPCPCGSGLKYKKCHGKSA